MTHIRMVVPNTTEAVYSLAKKTLVFLKFRSFVKQLIFDYDHINDNSSQSWSADLWASDTFGAEISINSSINPTFH